MTGIYEGFSAISHSIILPINTWMKSESMWVELPVNSILFLFGVVLMKSTGDLFWWLSESDYDIAKFDFHNRLRLKDPGAQTMYKFRQHPVWRCVFTMIGYPICYLATLAIYAHIPSLWGPPRQLDLDDLLPSNRLDLATYGLNETTFVCLNTCQEELDRLNMAQYEILKADYAYTSSTLPSNKHTVFWRNWVYSADTVDSSVPLLEGNVEWHEILHCLTVFVICLAILRLYGFVLWNTL